MDPRTICPLSQQIRPPGHTTTPRTVAAASPEQQDNGHSNGRRLDICGGGGKSGCVASSERGRGEVPLTKRRNAEDDKNGGAAVVQAAATYYFWERLYSTRRATFTVDRVAAYFGRGQHQNNNSGGGRGGTDRDCGAAVDGEGAEPSSTIHVPLPVPSSSQLRGVGGVAAIVEELSAWTEDDASFAHAPPADRTALPTDTRQVTSNLQTHSHNDAAGGAGQNPVDVVVEGDDESLEQSLGGSPVAVEHTHAEEQAQGETTPVVDNDGSKNGCGPATTDAGKDEEEEVEGEEEAAAAYEMAAVSAVTPSLKRPRAPRGSQENTARKKKPTAEPEPDAGAERAVNAEHDDDNYDNDDDAERLISLPASPQFLRKSCDPPAHAADIVCGGEGTDSPAPPRLRCSGVRGVSRPRQPSEALSMMTPQSLSYATLRSRVREHADGLCVSPAAPSPMFSGYTPRRETVGRDAAGLSPLHACSPQHSRKLLSSRSASDSNRASQEAPAPPPLQQQQQQQEEEADLVEELHHRAPSPLAQDSHTDGCKSNVHSPVPGRPPTPSPPMSSGLDGCPSPTAESSFPAVEQQQRQPQQTSPEMEEEEEEGDEGGGSVAAPVDKNDDSLNSSIAPRGDAPTTSANGRGLSSPAGPRRMPGAVHTSFDDDNGKMSIETEGDAHSDSAARAITPLQADLDAAAGDSANDSGCAEQLGSNNSNNNAPSTPPAPDDGDDGKEVEGVGKETTAHTSSPKFTVPPGGRDAVRTSCHHRTTDAEEEGVADDHHTTSRASSLPTLTGGAAPPHTEPKQSVEDPEGEEEGVIGDEVRDDAGTPSPTIVDPAADTTTVESKNEEEEEDDAEADVEKGEEEEEEEEEEEGCSRGAAPSMTRDGSISEAAPALTGSSNGAYKLVSDDDDNDGDQSSSSSSGSAVDEESGTCQASQQQQQQQQQHMREEISRSIEGKSFQWAEEAELVLSQQQQRHNSLLPPSTSHPQQSPSCPQHQPHEQRAATASSDRAASPRPVFAFSLPRGVSLPPAVTPAAAAVGGGGSAVHSGAPPPSRTRVASVSPPPTAPTLSTAAKRRPRTGLGNGSSSNHFPVNPPDDDDGDDDDKENRVSPRPLAAAESPVPHRPMPYHGNGHGHIRSGEGREAPTAALANLATNTTRKKKKLQKKGKGTNATATTAAAGPLTRRQRGALGNHSNKSKRSIGGGGGKTALRQRQRRAVAPLHDSTNEFALPRTLSPKPASAAVPSPSVSPAPAPVPAPQRVGGGAGKKNMQRRK